jgi:hypothetical protein
MSKNKTWLLVGIAVAGVASVVAFQVANPVRSSSDSSTAMTRSSSVATRVAVTGTSENVAPLATPPLNASLVSSDPMYVAGTELTSLSDAVKRADLVVLATVQPLQTYSAVVDLAPIKVQRAMKGTVPDNLGVLQLKGTDGLKTGETYLLFLGKQGDNKPHTYYVLGVDNQGAIRNNGTKAEGHPCLLNNAPCVFIKTQSVGARPDLSQSFSTLLAHVEADVK